MRATSHDRQRVLGLLGLGLDIQDGHKRITQTTAFLLVGGSTETHERMQETAARFEEALSRRGKTLALAEVGEVMDLLYEAEGRSPE